MLRACTTSPAHRLSLLCISATRAGSRKLQSPGRQVGKFCLHLTHTSTTVVYSKLCKLRRLGNRAESLMQPPKRASAAQQQLAAVSQQVRACVGLSRASRCYEAQDRASSRSVCSASPCLQSSTSVIPLVWSHHTPTMHTYAARGSFEAGGENLRAHRHPQVQTLRLHSTVLNAPHPPAGLPPEQLPSTEKTEP